jgi:hypothetical protein
LKEFLRNVFKEDTNWVFDKLSKELRIESIDDLESLDESLLKDPDFIKPA